MYNTVYALAIVIWVMDILDMPCIEFLDTSYPINTLAWLLIWALIPHPDVKGGEDE